MQDRESLIRQRAYEIWESQGRPKGRAEEHWEQACREVDEEREGKVGLQDEDKERG